MNQVHLRHARASDLDAIVALDRATDLAPHWPRSAYSAILDCADPPRCLIVAEQLAESAAKSLIGFAVGLMNPAGSPQDSIRRTGELEDVVVAGNSRRAGIGRALCTAVLEWCGSQGASEVRLEVRASSAGAIALYTGLGFTQAGSRSGYYHDPEDDALLLSLRIDQPRTEGS